MRPTSRAYVCLRRGNSCAERVSGRKLSFPGRVRGIQVGKAGLPRMYRLPLLEERERERQFVRGAREAALRLTSFVFVWTCAVAVEWLWSAKGARRGRERGVVTVDGGSRGARACKLSSTRGAKIKLRGGWNFKGPSVYCEGMWWWLQGGVLFGALRWYFTLYENILLSELQVSTAEKNLRFRN